MFRLRLFGLLLLFCGITSGCNRQPTANLVHGTVVFPDGQPLTRGTVEFEAMNQTKPITASGEIAKDGTFRLGTFAANDGAIAGEHRVAVVSDYEIGTGVERPGELPPLQIHPKFRSFKTSDPKFTIKPRMNNILVEVDYAHADAATKFTGRLRPISLGHMLEFGPLSELANDFVIVSSGQLS